MIWRKCGPEYLCIEANDFEVAISPLSKYLKDPSYKIEIYRPKVDIEHALKTMDNMVNLSDPNVRVGMLYGYLQLIGFALVILLSKIGIRRRHNIFSQGPICSEVVAWYFIYNDLLSKGDFLFHDKDINLISPQDLYEHVTFFKSEKFELVMTKNFGESVNYA